MKMALVHDWVVDLGGGEKCLQIFHELFPEAPLFTLVYKPASVQSLGFSEGQVQASMLQKRRQIQQNYRKYLPLFPYAIEQLDLSAYEVILSSSHCAAKGVLTRADQLHICYCHTPVRYAWDLMHQYLQQNRLERGIKSVLARIILHYIRMWDVQASNRVDYFIANSHYTAKRIWRVYRREAAVIYPPVNIERFRMTHSKDDYFLFVSRLVPYKKADLVIKTFTEIGLPLKVAGDGPQLDQCRKIAGKNIDILGHVENRDLPELMGRARALVFAAEEDFGIVPVEAQASGIPVIAFGRGGATESVIAADGSNWNRATGVYFYEHTVESLRKAIEQFLQCEDRFDRTVIRKNAERFNEQRYKEEINDFVKEKYQCFKNPECQERS